MARTIARPDRSRAGHDEARGRARVASRGSLRTLSGSSSSARPGIRWPAPGDGLPPTTAIGCSSRTGWASARVPSRWRARCCDGPPKASGPTANAFRNTRIRASRIERQMRTAVPIHPGVEQAKLSATLTACSEVLGRVMRWCAGAGGEVTGRPRRRARGRHKTGRRANPHAAPGRRPGGNRGLRGSVPRAGTAPRTTIARAAQSTTTTTSSASSVRPTRRSPGRVFAVRGDDAYPDGTFTLRLSYGQVKGYREAGDEVKPFTEFTGCSARRRQGMKPPYRYPDSWMKRARHARIGHALQPRHDQRHRRRQQRSPLINAQRRDRRADLRRQHPVAAAAISSTTAP